MADTTFVNGSTVIQASWLNEVNDHVYNNTPISPATTVHPASVIANTPAGSIAATTVQAAIDEIVSDLADSSGSSLVGFLPQGTGATSSNVQNKLYEFVSVLDFGAVGDGVTNDTSAVLAALTAIKTAGGGEIYFPPGSYLVDPIVITDLNYVTLRGSNKFISVLKLRATGTLLTLSNAQWPRIEKLGFFLNGTPQAIANTYGLQLDSGSGNGIIEDCAFVGFAEDGLRLAGVVGTQMSGHKVTNNYFLGNGNHQFYSEYSNDFHYENNQFGRLVGITNAVTGCYLTNSSAGTYKGNYHWNNVRGMQAVSCNYNTYSLNRFEESDQENVYINGGSYTVFTSNKCHTASNQTTATYDNVYITGASVIDIQANVLFTWNAFESRWGINIDTGCSDVTLGKNKVSGFNTSFGPYRVDGTVGAIAGDFEIRGATHQNSGAGQTTYIGQQLNTFTEALAIANIPKRCQVLRIYSATDVAPSAGQTFTYTLRKNTVDTVATATSSGAASFSAAANNTAPAVLVAVDDGLSMKLVTSAGAAAASHRWYVSLAEY